MRNLYKFIIAIIVVIVLFFIANGIFKSKIRNFIADSLSKVSYYEIIKDVDSVNVNIGSVNLLSALFGDLKIKNIKVLYDNKPLRISADSIVVKDFSFFSIYDFESINIFDTKTVYLSGKSVFIDEIVLTPNLIQDSIFQGGVINVNGFSLPYIDKYFKLENFSKTNFTLNIDKTNKIINRDSKVDWKGENYIVSFIMENKNFVVDFSTQINDIDSIQIKEFWNYVNEFGVEEPLFLLNNNPIFASAFGGLKLQSFKFNFLDTGLVGSLINKKASYLRKPYVDIKKQFIENASLYTKDWMLFNGFDKVVSDSYSKNIARFINEGGKLSAYSSISIPVNLFKQARTIDGLKLQFDSSLYSFGAFVKRMGMSFDFIPFVN